MKINWNTFRKEKLGYSGTENLAKIKANANEAFKKEQEEEAVRKAAKAAENAVPVVTETVVSVNCKKKPSMWNQTTKRKNPTFNKNIATWKSQCEKKSPYAYPALGGRRKTQKRKSMKRKTHKRR